MKDLDGHITDGIAVGSDIEQDKNTPQGSIALENREPCQSFVNLITFGLFFKDEQSVKITAEDGGSGISESKYLVINKDLIENASATVEEISNTLDNQAGWQTFTGDSIEISLEKDNRYVVYEKLTDNVGHVTYRSSDGVVIDKIGPTISGVEEGIYYASRKVTVKDKYLDTVTVNGEPQKVTDGKSEFTLKNNNTVYEIEAKDKVGNITKRRVELKPVQQFTEKVEENLLQKLTVDDIDNYRQAIIETDDFTAKEKNNLTDHEKNALTEKRQELFTTFKSLASEKSVNIYVERSLPTVKVETASKKILASHFTDEDTDIVLNGGEVELKLEINPGQPTDSEISLTKDTSKKEPLSVADYLDISVKKYTKSIYKNQIQPDKANVPIDKFEDEGSEDIYDLPEDTDDTSPEQEEEKRLSELSDAITISMDIPTKYQATDRKFYMIKVRHLY